uniref:Uncharacterized protein n=1 Tax=Salmonella enterica I TaxID=59201 RepID=A0A410J935_SALET|nr:hypothetical protein [Salmonella enterica subsp. enterica]
MDCRAFRVSSVFITVSPLLPPRLRRGGVVVHQAASARLAVCSVASVCGRGAHIQPGTQRLSFIWNSACSAASPFFIFSASRAAPDSPASFRAAIICGFFRCPKKFAFVGCHQSRM